MSEIRADKLHNASGDNDSGIDLSTNDQVVIKTADTTAITVDSSQNTTLTGALTLVSTDAGASAGPIFDLYRNSASPADEDLLGRISFTGESEGTGIHSYGTIDMEVNGVGDGSEKGKMIFKVSLPDGDLQNIFHIDRTEICVNEDSEDIDFRVESDINTHAMFVQGSDGRIGFNTIPDSNRRFHIKSDQSAAFIQMIEMTSTGSKFGLDIFTSGTANNDNNSEFIRCRDTGAVRFRVMSDGDVQNDDNSYGSISDVKLKEQITDASSQWEDIKALRVRKFKLKEDVANGDSDALWKLGVVAQEVETAGMSGLVKDNPDLVEDDDGFFVDSGTTTKSVKYSILYMKAVKALQEAMTRIETLEAKVTALESE